MRVVTVVLLRGEDLTEEQMAALRREDTQPSRFAPAWLALLIGLLLVVLGLIVVPLLQLWIRPGSDVLSNIALFLVGAGAVLIGAAIGRHR